MDAPPKQENQAQLCSLPEVVQGPLLHLAGRNPRPILQKPGEEGVLAAS